MITTGYVRLDPSKISRMMDYEAEVYALRVNGFITYEEHQRWVTHYRAFGQKRKFSEMLD